MILDVTGYVARKLDCKPEPMLRFILGPMMKEYIRRAMLDERREITS